MKKSCIIILLACLSQLLFANMQPVSSVFNLEIGTNYYEVDFNMPEYELVSTGTTNCGTFNSIIFPNDSTQSMLDIPGLPILPMYNLMLELPMDAHNIRVVTLIADSEIISTTYPIEPAHIEHYNETTGELLSVDCYDDKYYERGFGRHEKQQCFNYLCSTYDSITAQFYTQHIVFDTIRYRGVLGLSLTVVPMLYALKDAEINLLNDARILIEFDANSTLGEMISLHNSKNKLKDHNIRNYFDTYTIVNTPPTTTDKGKFLIFVPQRIYNNLQSRDSLIAFEDHKSSLGYNVIRYVYQTNLLTEEVKSVIIRYDPDYILLCGNKSDIPEASIEDGIYSDRGYAINDAAVGRWLLSATSQDGVQDFINIVTKTLKSERHYSNVGTAALFSGTDKHSYMRWEFNRCTNYIENKFSGTSIATVKTNGSNSNSNFTKMKTILKEQHPMLFVYDGHGAQYKIGSPYNLHASNISQLQNNTNPYLPMSFGFACLLNDYSVSGCFGEKWLTKECGGVTIYGATTISYTTPNFYLAKRIFDYFRKDIDNNEAIRMGRLVYDASKKYYDMCKTGVRRKQYRKYNYFGDPTISVFGIDNEGTDLRPAMIPRNIIELIDESDREAIGYELYTIMGIHIASFSKYEDLQTFMQTYSGTVIVQIIHTDNSIEVIKLFK